jgi:4a-hydroxytetrahydrobiopterin dehydratase
MMNEGGIMTVLNQNEINEKLDKVSGWKFENNQIGKEFKLRDFKSALEFVNKVGAEAESMDHHPDILMHSWNKVKISVSTHSEGGVTEKDFKLAGKIEGFNI